MQDDDDDNDENDEGDIILGAASWRVLLRVATVCVHLCRGQSAMSHSGVVRPALDEQHDRI